MLSLTSRSLLDIYKLRVAIDMARKGDQISRVVHILVLHVFCIVLCPSYRHVSRCT